MNVVVVFRFPEIEDPDSEEADLCIEVLTDDLEQLKNQTGYKYHIEEVFGSDPEN